jgi:hypothetical protein
MKVFNSIVTAQGVGDSGTGPHNALLMQYGPDKNGKDIIFVSTQHRDPNECCFNALADLLVYEQHKEPTTSSSDVNPMDWLTNPKAQSPLLFHAPGSPMRPISKKIVGRDLIDALIAVGAPPYIERIVLGSNEDIIQAGHDRETQESFILATAKPCVTPKMLQNLEAREYCKSMKAIIYSVCRLETTTLWRFLAPIQL